MTDVSSSLQTIMNENLINFVDRLTKQIITDLIFTVKKQKT